MLRSILLISACLGSGAFAQDSYFFDVSACATQVTNSIRDDNIAMTISSNVVISPESTMICENQSCSFVHDTSVDTSLDLRYRRRGSFEGCVNFSFFDASNRTASIRVIVVDEPGRLVSDTAWGDLIVGPGTGYTAFFRCEGSLWCYVRLEAVDVATDSTLSTSENLTIRFCKFPRAIDVDSVRALLVGNWNWGYTVSEPSGGTSQVYRTDWQDKGYDKAITFTIDSFYVYRDGAAEYEGLHQMAELPAKPAGCYLGGAVGVELPNFVMGSAPGSAAAAAIVKLQLDLVGTEALRLTLDADGLSTATFFKEGVVFEQVGVVASAASPSRAHQSARLRCSSRPGRLRLEYSAPRGAEAQLYVVNARGAVVLSGRPLRTASEAGSTTLVVPALADGQYIAVLKVNGITAATAKFVAMP